MADNPTACDDYFDDCSKTEITWSMFWKKLIGKSGDCPALRVVVASTVAPTGTQRSVTSDIFSADGNVPLGARWINFNTDADFVGTINGKTLASSMNFLMPPMGNDTYGSVVFTRSAGTIRIDYAS